MSKTTKIIISVVIIAIVALMGWWYVANQIYKNNTKEEYIPMKVVLEGKEKRYEAIQKSINNIDPDISHWKTYKNSAYRFSMKYPPTWVMSNATPESEESDTQQLVSFADPLLSDSRKDTTVVSLSISRGGAVLFDEDKKILNEHNKLIKIENLPAIANDSLMRFAFAHDSDYFEIMGKLLGYESILDTMISTIKFE